MHASNLGWLAAASLTIACLTACGKNETPPPAGMSSKTDQTTQAATPAPAGDATPKAIDSSTKSSVASDEKTGQTSDTRQVGTAAAGSPPYTLNAAPEGNPAPQQGSKSGSEAPKK